MKEQTLNEELDAVNSLKEWEKHTLKEVDPKFEIEDDSDQEEGEGEKKEWDGLET